jgi:hypothetical protein
MAKTFLIENGIEIPIASDRGIYTERIVSYVECSGDGSPNPINSWQMAVITPISGNLQYCISNNTFVAPRDELYRITHKIKLSNGTITTVGLILNKNKTPITTGTDDSVIMGNNSTTFNNGVNSGTLRLIAGDVIRFWYLSTVSGLSSFTQNIIIEELLEQVPYIVADSGALISSNNQGDIALRQDGTAFINDDYSFTEQATNKRWVDGRIVYNKSFSTTLPSIAAYTTYTIGTIASLLPGATLIVDSKVVDFRTNVNAPDHYFSFVLNNGNLGIWNEINLTYAGASVIFTLWYVK